MITIICEDEDLTSLDQDNNKDLIIVIKSDNISYQWLNKLMDTYSINEKLCKNVKVKVHSQWVYDKLDLIWFGTVMKIEKI